MSDRTGKYTKGRKRPYAGSARPTSSSSGYAENRGYFPRGYTDNSRIGDGSYRGAKPSTLRPANAATAYFRRYKPNPLAFGRKAGAVAQAARPFGMVLAKTATAGFLGPFLFTGGAEELVDFVLAPNAEKTGNGSVRYPVNGYWEKRYGDFGPYSGYNVANGLWRHTFPQTKAISGQALGGTVLANADFTWDTDNDYGLWYVRYSPVERYAHHSSYYRITNGLDPAITSHDWVNAAAYSGGSAAPMLNPNIVRDMPPAPIRDPIEKAKEDELEAEEALTDPDFWSATEIGVFVPDFNVGGPVPKVKPDMAIDVKVDLDQMAPPVDPHDRSPPTNREKEGKPNPSRLKQLGVAFFRVADIVSESAEVVDAVFKALPADVQARWSKGRSKPWYDQVGQYGTGGISWKIEALWHNWHKVDYEQAVVNIAKNEVEDRLYGKYHKYKDKMLQRGEHRRSRSKSDHFTSELVGQGFYQAETQFFKTVYGK